jgi:hypothetical protein
MRTTVNIDDALLDHARQVAIQARRSLGDVIDDALRVLFATRLAEAGSTTLTLPTYGGSGLQPGVDLEDKDALSALLDEERDVRAAG